MIFFIRLNLIILYLCEYRARNKLKRFEKVLFGITKVGMRSLMNIFQLNYLRMISFVVLIEYELKDLSHIEIDRAFIVHFRK